MMRIGIGEDGMYDSGILSVQTAMRQSDGINVREYTTKRICISVVFSVGFFSLICGFLLGKFVADREHIIRHNAEKVHIRELQSVESILLLTARNITSFDPHIRPEHNKQLWGHLMECLKSDPQPTNEILDVYVKNVVDHSYKELLRCLRNLDDVIREIHRPNNL